MSKNYIIGLISILVLFVSLFVILSCNMRLASDDYFGIWDVKEHGILQSTYLQYIQWCGRYFAIFVYYLVYKLFDLHQYYYFVLSVILYLFLVFGIYRSFLVFSDHFNYRIATLQKWLASFSFSALLFFLSIDIGETWFWYSSLASYLWSVIAFIWGMTFLYSKKNNLLSYSAIILCFTFCGGSSEVYSVIYGLLLFSLLIYQLRKYKGISLFINESFNKKLLLVLFSLSISFLIVVVASGNYSRATQFPDPTILTTFKLTGRMLLKLFCWFLPQKLIYVFVFSVPFLLIGKSLNRGESISIISFLHKFKVTTILLILSSVIVFALISILMSQSGEYRIWFIISFLIAIYIAIIAASAGYYGLFSNKQIQAIKKISIPTGLLIMSFQLITQYEVTKKYAQACDQRIIYLTQLSKTNLKDTTISLPPLPPKGMLYSSEIATDTNYFANKELRLGLNLIFNVIVENKH